MYKGAPIIIFGDFNLTRNRFREKVESNLGLDYQYHYLKGEKDVSRRREIEKNGKKNVEESYLD